MRYVRFRDVDGHARRGEWTDDGIEFAGRTYDPADVDVLPPSEPTKVVGVSANNRTYLEETGMEPPERPRLFVKAPNAVIGHGDTAVLSPADRDFHYEGEMAIVIGEHCRDVPAEDALDVVAGYTCTNDISNVSDRDDRGVRLKTGDNMSPIGPVVATPDEVPADADAELRINGEVRQSSNRSRLRFGVPAIIEEITTYMTLEPGDVIPTGSLGAHDSLEDGDRVEIEIEGIGTLEHHVQLGGE